MELDSALKDAAPRLRRWGRCHTREIAEADTDGVEAVLPQDSSKILGNGLMDREEGV